MGKLCPKCGKENIDSAKFCEDCGARIPDFGSVKEPAKEPVEEPVKKPAGKPVGKPMGKPLGKSFSKPVDQPAGKPTGKTFSKPVDAPVHSKKDSDSFLGGNGLKIAAVVGVCCIGIIIILAVLGFMSMDQNTFNLDSNSTSSSSGATWHSVATYTGTENKDTDTFNIQGDKFKVKVTAKANADYVEYGYFSVFVYPQGESTSYAGQETIDTFDTTTETLEFTVNEGPGTYYLSVLAANLDQWNVEVFDYY